jgi:integrating conjugative element protein (TIGR03757 family)
MPYRLLFLAFGCAFAVHAGAADIRVYTDHSIALQNTQGATVVFLDAPRRLEQTLSTGLPADPGRAEVIVQKRLHADIRPQRDLMEAWQGVVDAWRLGIVRLPAVVADGAYVIYGEPDVAKAVARIAAYRSRRP